jgi:hypothetical protein
MAFEDLRPHIEGRAAGRLARERVPEGQGSAHRVFPAEWLTPLRRD